MIAWSLLTVPARAEAAADLLTILPDLHVCLDATGAGMRATQHRAFAAGVATDARWVGVLQDDVRLCNDFAARALSRVVEAEVGGALALSLHCQRREVAAVARGQRWWRQPGGTFRNDQCVILRHDLAVRFLDYAAPLRDEHPNWPDVLLADFLAEAGLAIWQSCPSLVQHRLDLPSTIGTPARVWGRLREAPTWHTDAR